ncbi:MAG: hypothetical protein LC664_02435 [Flavobacteriales bacterium]|nr:hypothetical protein [Flavobacteriales bacterium]
MRYVFVIFTSLLSIVAFAESDTLHVHYHENGKVSTLSILDENRFGSSKAYNKSGKLIYEKPIRRVAGIATVAYTHYNSGSVKTATYTDQPDGGIQWYKGYTWFSEDGVITKEKEDDYNYDPSKVIQPDFPVPEPHKRPEKTPKNPYPNRIPKKKTQPDKKQIPEKEKRAPEIIECASIHTNTVRIINHCAYKLDIVLIHQNKYSRFTLKPGDTYYGPSYISAEISSPVDDNMNFRYSTPKKRKNPVHLIETVKRHQYETNHTINLFNSAVSRE